MRRALALAALAEGHTDHVNRPFPILEFIGIAAVVIEQRRLCMSI